MQQLRQSANALLTDQDVRRTIRNLRDITTDVNHLVGILNKPGTSKEWRKTFINLAAAIDSGRKTTESLASQLEKLPPDSAAHVVRQMEQTLFQVNQVLTNLKGLIHELREEPGKILKIPKGKEPFRR
jgi:methyl-accepting chemotaxis protein